MLKPNKLLTLGLAIGLGTGLLSACSGQPTEKEPAPNTQLLSSLTIRDAGLKNCIDTQAKEHNWTRVDQVVSLNCKFLNKQRVRSTEQILKNTPLPDSLFPIKDTSELATFTGLLDLNLSGNLYTKIDVSKLTQLEKIDLSNAFIQDIDLRANKKLVSLNLTGTGLTRLDLSGLKSLKELYVSLKGTGADYDPYQGWILEQGAKIYSFNLEHFLKPNIQITLDPTAQLTKVETSLTTFIDIPNNKSLVSISGQVNATTLVNAPNLRFFGGDIIGSGLLDLSRTPLLEAISISNTSFDEVIINKNLKNIYISGALKRLTSTKDSTLASITIGAAGDSPINLGPDKIDLTQLPVRSLHIYNFSSGELLDLSASVTLENIEVSHSTYGAIKLPISARSLNLSSSTVMEVTQTEQLESLSMEGCPFAKVSPPNLNHLSVINCTADYFEFTRYPKLTSFSLENSVIGTIDFTSAFDLDTLNIQQSTINKMDFTPLGNKKRTRLYFLGNHLPSPESLRVQAIKIFSDFNWINNN